MPVTALSLQKIKDEGGRFAVLTAYDALTASLMDAAGIDAILVGDSLGMVVLGHPDTLSVTMDDMVRHTAAVTRAVKNAWVMADMPFGSYQVSVEQTVENAVRLIKEGGANAVKLEGGAVYADRVSAVVAAGIPVVGHIGLTPQSVNALGGFRVQGKTQEAAARLMQDAQALEQAGVSAVVLECMPAALAGEITRTLSVPTIGIGAGPQCTGQVLVGQDMLGMNEAFAPRFVRRYAELGREIRRAAAQYAEDVRSGAFPGEKESF